MKRTKASANGKLEVNNFGIIKEIKVSLDRSLIVVGGRNGQGKTTLLNSVAAAISGKRGTDTGITEGAKKGQIVLEIGDIKIHRRFDSKGNWDLAVSVGDQSPKSAQALLDGLRSKLSFDWQKFYSTDAKTQRSMLLEACGIDLTGLEAEYKRHYDERTLLNRELKKIEGALDKFNMPFDYPDELLDLGELSSRLEYIQNNNRRRQYELSVITESNERMNSIREEVAKLKAEFKSISDLKSETELNMAEFIDPEPVKDLINNSNDLNALYHEGLKRTELSQEAAATKALIDRAEKQLEINRQERTYRLTGAAMPLKSLSVSDDEVLVDGFPLSQASGRNRLLVAASVACAIADEQVPLVCMDGLEQLDDEGMKMLEEIANQYAVIVLGTRVSTDEHCSFIMEDGVMADYTWSEGVWPSAISGTDLMALEAKFVAAEAAEKDEFEL